MRAGAAFALLACAAAGTAFTLTRAITLARAPVPVVTHGMCAPAELLGRERLSYPAHICAIELPDDGWRPLRIGIALRDGGTGGGRVTARISVNAEPSAHVTVGERWTTHHVDAPPRLPNATRITLRIEVPAAVASRDGDPPIQVGRVDVTRELTIARLLRDGLGGALAAVMLWWLIIQSRLPHTPLAPRSPKGAGGDTNVGVPPTSPPQTHGDSVAARPPDERTSGIASRGPAGDHLDSVAVHAHAESASGLDSSGAERERDSVAARPLDESTSRTDPREPEREHRDSVAVHAGAGSASGLDSSAVERERDSVAARPLDESTSRIDPRGPAREHRDSAAVHPRAGSASGLDSSGAARERDSVAARTGRAHWRGAVVLASLLFVYFVAWALLRPPYQTPDEVQHHLRATSVLRHPWVAGAGEWSLDPRFVNPIALWTPGSLDKLFFHVDERLTLAEVAALERMPWPAADARPAPETFQRAIASYPTLYYWPVFLLGEAATRALHLTPYQSTYAYRIVTAALAAMLWGLVYLTIRRVLSPASESVAPVLVGMLVLNPMVPFMSSGINPDAVNVPLAALSMLFVWEVMSTGTRSAATLACVALVATAWTKPSGLQMIPAFAVTGAALWALGYVTFERLRLAAASIGLAAAIAWCGFYAWSPPRFVGGPPVVDRWTTYLATRWQELPWTWQTYWGTLGWLEYTAPIIWYQALAVLTAISLICVLVRPLTRPQPTPRLFAGYAALFLVAFLAVTLAGEFVFLPTAGYFLQGRHLLPAALGLAGLMWHRVRPVKVAFFAVLIAMNVLLIHQTVERYYTRGWSAVASALPFGN